MMQDWRPEMIRFLQDAISCTEYYEKLAAKIAEHLPPDAHVCDAGCGMGALGLALLPYCRRVTAIDQAEAPLEALRQYVAGRRIQNLEIRCENIQKNPPRTRYDAMVFCLFGSTETVLEIAARQCVGSVIVIKRDHTNHDFCPDLARKTPCTADMAEWLLRRLGIPISTERFVLELGQPFQSLEDAARFFRLYGGGTEQSEAALRRKLQIGPSREFPYYLPNQKRLRLLCFSAEALRKSRREKS